MIKRTVYLKNMVSKSCIKLIELYFKQINEIKVRRIFLGEVFLEYNPAEVSEQQLAVHFENIGFNIIVNPDEILTEQIKIAAIELIYYANNTNSLIRNSEYLSDRVQESYSKISKVFKSQTGYTIEKYLILLKIEKAKELIYNNEHSLSEISYMLGYSSVQYLSNQFKKITGYTVSQFKKQNKPNRIPLEDLI
jgi:AraC-like DNA-binding protein